MCGRSDEVRVVVRLRRRPAPGVRHASTIRLHTAMTGYTTKVAADGAREPTLSAPWPQKGDGQACRLILVR